MVAFRLTKYSHDLHSSIVTIHGSQSGLIYSRIPFLYLKRKDGMGGMRICPSAFFCIHQYPNYLIPHIHYLNTIVPFFVRPYDPSFLPLPSMNSHLSALSSSSVDSKYRA